MSKAEEYSLPIMVSRIIDRYLPPKDKEREQHRMNLHREFSILVRHHHQIRVNATNDDDIKDIIFKNQCYGNSTKMVKEIKELIKQ